MKDQLEFSFFVLTHELHPDWVQRSVDDVNKFSDLVQIVLQVYEDARFNFCEGHQL